MKKLYLLTIFIAGCAYSQTGSLCTDPIVIASLPYSTTDNTANYGDNYDPPTATPIACGAGTSGNFYLSGNDALYSFTSSFTGNVNIKIPSSVAWTGLFVYTSCAGIGAAPYACNCSSGAGDRTINNMAVTEGQTYYIVVSSWAAPQTIAYTLNVTNANLAIEENVVSKSIDLYPNPVKNELTITSLATIKSIVLYTINGQRVVQKAVDFNKVSLSDVPNGFYMVEMTDDSGAVYTKKLLKSN